MEFNDRDMLEACGNWARDDAVRALNVLELPFIGKEHAGFEVHSVLISIDRLRFAFIRAVLEGDYDLPETMHERLNHELNRSKGDNEDV